MEDNRIIRAWKDTDYRASSGADAGGDVPPSPVGGVTLPDDALAGVAGGDAEITVTTICATTWACVTVATIAISKNMSCGACDTTLWSGTCAVSSVGCCAPTP